MMPAPILTALSLGFAAYLVVIGVYIIAENRRPSATLAWMLLFALLPGAGVVLYLLFGRQHQSFGLTGKLMRQELDARLAPLIAGLAPEHREALARMEAEDGSAAS